LVVVFPVDPFEVAATRPKICHVKYDLRAKFFLYSLTPFSFKEAPLFFTGYLSSDHDATWSSGCPL